MGFEQKLSHLLRKITTKLARNEGKNTNIQLLYGIYIQMGKY